MFPVHICKSFTRMMAVGLMAVLVMAVIISCGKKDISSADDILDEIGISRGICALLGDVKCERAIELAKNSELIIYVQLQRDEDVEEARRMADDAGFYGMRIFVEKGGLSRVHMANNIADALIAVGDATAISKDEALRVVCPQGKAIVGKNTYVKSFPEEADDWSHPYHAPDNNPQSNDKIAAAPYLTQFLAEPYYAPMPQITVASAGKVFRALGHIAFKQREETYLNTLMAYNGYNGTILWKRNIVPKGIMVHRNTIIATPTTLYYADDKSCKLIDAATGELRDEIAPTEDAAGGTFWKWMALENGVLYALIGEQEMSDPEVRQKRDQHGWPWNPLSEGYNMPENPWGFGRNLLAIDPKTKEVLWVYREDKPIDSRALCMKNGRIYAFRFGEYLTCIDAGTGEVIWRRTKENDSDIFNVLGKDLNRQDWQTNWRTTAYLKCSNEALYFAGPMMDKLIVLSAKDGSIMWHHPYDNFQLILRDDGLYGISGPWTTIVSKKFDPLTGEVLGKFDIGRRACARPTGSADAIFFRANGGTVRFDLAAQRPHYISPMRPNCHDGVTIANGLLYWWPSVCDCQLTLYGVTCLGPAGEFDFSRKAAEADRLETSAASAAVESLSESQDDWLTFRGNNICSAKTEAAVFEKSEEIWQFIPKTSFTPTAPVTSGGLVFLSGSDGIVRALDASTGKPQWTAYTGGSVRISPTVWKGRVFAGSGDGWVYCLEAKTGKQLWRFRAAPQERKIPVYGKLLSTWPAASGVLVEDGTAYVAAGISNFDGIHVYALDAETGEIKWQNNTSGHLNREARTGAGVQGHLLLYDGKLYLAGGNAVSPAVYDIKDGKCLNNGELLNTCESICLRGWELYLVGDKVVVGGQPFYRDPEYPVYDATLTEKILHTSTGEKDIIWFNNKWVRCYNPIDKKLLNKCVYEREYPGHHIIKSWGRLDVENTPIWEYGCEGSVALALCKNGVVIAKKDEIAAINLQDGTVLWTQQLPASPVPWGTAVNRYGSTIVTLEDGRVICFGKSSI